MSIARDDLLAVRKKSGCLGPCFRRLLGTHEVEAAPAGTDDTTSDHSVATSASETMERYTAAPSAASCIQTRTAAPSPVAIDLFQFLSRERKALEFHSPELIDALHRKLSRLQAIDLSVQLEDTLHLRTGIGYQEVYCGHEMTLCIFLLRAGAVIPLHDHPGMHVFCRLLFGRMRVLSFDPEPGCSALDAGARGRLVQEAPDSGSRYSLDCHEGDLGQLDGDKAPCAAGSSGSAHAAQALPLGLPLGSRWASLHSDEVLGPGPVTYSLGPDEGNVHELEAIENCAFFDVVTPPYDPATGRDCTYYLRKNVDGASRCILVPTVFPYFSTETLRYRGPSFRTFSH